MFSLMQSTKRKTTNHIRQILTAGGSEIGSLPFRHLDSRLVLPFDALRVAIREPQRASAVPDGYRVCPLVRILRPNHPRINVVAPPLHFFDHYILAARRTNRRSSLMRIMPQKVLFIRGARTGAGNQRIRTITALAGGSGRNGGRAQKASIRRTVIHFRRIHIGKQASPSDAADFILSCGVLCRNNISITIFGRNPEYSGWPKPSVSSTKKSLLSSGRVPCGVSPFWLDKHAAHRPVVWPPKRRQNDGNNNADGYHDQQ